MRLMMTLAAASSLLAVSQTWGQSVSDRAYQVMQQRASTNPSKADMLGMLLYKDVSVRFEQTQARDAINHMATLIGVTIVARYTDDKTGGGAGIDPDTTVTLDAQNQPALTVLEMVLEQTQGEDEASTWQIRNGFVEIGPKSRLSVPAAREIRYYPVRDLLFEPTRFDNAPSLNLGQAFGSGGGGGGGGGRGGGGGGFGGGGGGGRGGGSGGGSGGGIFGDTTKTVTRPSEEEKSQELIDLITQIVETEAWENNGGEIASIRYYQGVLIVRAPDYIHRQIGGYPSANRPTRISSAAEMPQRFVTFTGVTSNVEIIGAKHFTAVGAVGGAGGIGGTPAAPGPAPAQPAPQGNSGGK